MPSVRPGAIALDRRPSAGARGHQSCAPSRGCSERRFCERRVVISALEGTPFRAWWVGLEGQSAAEGFDDFWVELAAGVALELGDRVILAAGCLVAALGGHGLVGVTRGDDAGTKGNCGAGQTVGVTVAVPAFVTGSDESGDGPAGWGGVEDAFTDDGVLVHELPFGVVQRPGLIQDFIRDGELADVVELGCPQH